MREINLTYFILSASNTLKWWFYFFPSPLWDEESFSEFYQKAE